MEINTNQLNNLDIQSTGKVTNMKLDGDSEAMIFQMFTGGLYSDPIGTVIREITSNCFDSHVEANVESFKNPVLVKLGNDISGHHISFTDRGVGMSPDRVENIYGTYFKSTKRNTNNQIGGFGLGGKTPLAYTESFYIITRFEGIEYVYNIFEANQKPAIELMSQTSTDKPNGTTVKIPIKQSDILEFEQKTLRQLYYFENIIFEGFSDRYVSNNYNIVKGKNFLFRGTEYSQHMHICYGKVAYPLDYDAMGLDRYNYNVPIAVRLEIGDLEGTGVTPSREAIKYTKHNVQIIKKKMEEALEELKNKLAKQYDNVVTLMDYYKVKENFGKLYFGNDSSINLSNIMRVSDINYTKFRFNDLAIPNASEIIDFFYDVKLYGKKFPKRKYNKKKGLKWTNGLEKINEIDNIYYVDGEFNRKVKKQSYLKTLYKSENFYVVTPKKLKGETLEKLKLKLGLMKMKDNGSLELVVNKAKGERLIEELSKELHEIIVNYCKDYNEVEVSEEFIESKKRERLSKEILNTTIPVKSFSSYWNNSERVRLEEFNKIKGKIYYGFADDELELNSASKIHDSFYTHNKMQSKSVYNLTNNNKKNYRGTWFIRIAKGNEKYMKMLGKKAIHVKHFYKTFITRKIDDIINNMIGYKLEHKFYDVADYLKRADIMKHVYPEIVGKVKIIQNFLRKNRKVNFFNYLNTTILKKDVGVNLEEVVTKNGLNDIITELLDLTEKNRDSMKWINIPYHEVEIEIECNKKLIELLQLVFDK